jgi:para-aminobenzoate synthetase component 2
MTHVLVIDNYDSFVYTLNGYLQQLGATTEVVRNDAFAAAANASLDRKSTRLNPSHQI